MYHVRLILQLVQAHPDVLTMQGAQHWILLVVELLGHEYTLVTIEGDRLGERCLTPFRCDGNVYIIDGAPRAVHPVGSGL